MSRAESAIIIGLRVNAHAIPVPTAIESVDAASHIAWVERAAEELHGPDAVDAGGLGGARLLSEVADGIAERRRSGFGRGRAAGSRDPAACRAQSLPHCFNP